MVSTKPGPLIFISSDSSPSLDEVILNYELSNRAEGKSPKTIGWYNDMLQMYSRYCKEQFEEYDISGLNIDNARAYVNYLRHRRRFKDHPFLQEQTQPLSPKTIQCHVRVLKAFSTWMYQEEYSEENTLKNLKLPKAPTKVIEPLSPEEIKKVSDSINIKSSTGIRNRTILSTMLDTGLRASEVANITLANLNLNDGYIKVMGKGAKERLVPIGKYVQGTLWHYIDTIRPDPIGSNHNNLFLSHSGKRVTVNTIKLVFSRMAKSSGVTRLHAHLCRHTFAINYLLNGGDIFSLKNILGHSTLEMVNHYLHFTSSQITKQHQLYSPMDKLTSEISNRQQDNK
ncbi:tyrosine-type recombinase/integrase [Chloroflexota bacterium]